MKTIKHEIRIRIVTENVDGKIEAFINRPDRHKSFFYNSISPASVNRLHNLVEGLRQNGYCVYYGNDDNGNFTSSILLQ